MTKNNGCRRIRPYVARGTYAHEQLLQIPNSSAHTCAAIARSKCQPDGAKFGTLTPHSRENGQRLLALIFGTARQIK